MKNLERQVGQLARQAERPNNIFSSDTIPNPKEECKAIQLRSGRTLENEKVDSKVATEEKDQEKLKKKEEELQAPRKRKHVMKEHTQEQRMEVKPYIPPLPYPQRLSIEKVKPTRMSLQLADRSMVIPNGMVENLLVKVCKSIFPVDFVILDLDEEGSDSIILGRPFLATTRAIINVEKREMTLRAHDE
ncbi:uncharacterized protein LOC107611050 [Arachis ipaensis]|uniref:uncharacterized protein LOC107611050 n=1 Tax=Arachis ipaensis TaxID=130454 RepID=UPI0007AFD3D8|nr:uncharacterized protein LOC107611050 [Arachis ipaensis]